MESYDALYKSTKSDKFRSAFPKDDAAGLVRAIDDLVSCHVQSIETIRQCLVVSSVDLFLIAITWTSMQLKPNEENWAVMFDYN